MSALDVAVEEVLQGIYDPCSVAAGNPISIRDMGLILGWEQRANGDLAVRMCVTSACCTMAPHFTEAAREQLAQLPGVREVEIDIDAGHLWGPDQMTERGQAVLAARRQATIAVTGVRPRAAARAAG